MLNLKYIIGFSVLFFLFFSVVASASVVGLRGGENQGDPGSVGDQRTFGEVTEAQEAIAKKAEEIGEATQGQTSGPRAEAYQERVEKVLGIKSCDVTGCNYLNALVIHEIGVDPEFPKFSAEAQYADLFRRDDIYHTYSLNEQARSSGCNKPVDSPKRGDLLYTIRGTATDRQHGHAGVYLGKEGNRDKTAEASLRKHSPQIEFGLAGFECGARLKSLSLPSPQPAA